MGLFSPKPKNEKRDNNRPREQKVKCTDCQGRGWNPNARGGRDHCFGCNGTGWVFSWL